MKTQPKWRIKLIREGLVWKGERFYGAFRNGEYLWGSSGATAEDCCANAKGILASGRYEFCRNGSVR